MIKLRLDSPQKSKVTATINRVGAAMVTLEVGSLSLLQRFVSDTPPMGAGITLAPWPNRVRNGLWVASGKPQQLELTENGKPNAIHGLVRHTTFEQFRDSCDASQVALETNIGPEPGWDFKVNLRVTYRVVDDGLIVTYRARNDGEVKAPFAVGSHPYFVIGTTSTESLVITVPAEVVFICDQGGIPVGRQKVSGDQDLRGGRRVGDIELGHCYTEFTQNNGKNTATLATQGDEVLQIWADPAFAYWMLFNPHNFPGPDGPVRAIAIEPMTAPPDALNSGEGLQWLLPGEEWQVSWGVSIQADPPAMGSHLPDSIDK